MLEQYKLNKNLAQMLKNGINIYSAFIREAFCTEIYYSILYQLV